MLAMFRYGLFFALLAMAQATFAIDFWDDQFGDLKGDVEQARDEGKAGVFVFFEMDDCPFCHRMKEEIFSDQRVQDYMKDNFVTVAVDIEGDVIITNFKGEEVSQKDFAFKEYRVRATPVMIFVDTDGQLAIRHTGPTRTVEEFLALGEFVRSGAYKQPGMNFVRYKREQGL